MSGLYPMTILRAEIVWSLKDPSGVRGTIGNPRLDVTDIADWAEFAHRHGVPLIVDNTFVTPYLTRPIESGADVVVHSLTKWMGGHGNSIGGIVVDSGKFDYDTPRYPQFSKPDASYHGKVLGRDFGPVGYAVRLRVKLLRDTGSTLSLKMPF